MYPHTFPFMPYLSFEHKNWFSMYAKQTIQKLFVFYCVRVCLYAHNYEYALTKIEIQSFFELQNSNNKNDSNTHRQFHCLTSVSN